MFFKNSYKNQSEFQIRPSIEIEGFDPVKIANSPGYVYSTHSHPETKLLAILSGSMEVKTGGKKYQLEKGDKLIIPGNIAHSALVGPAGCSFFRSEKIAC